MTATFDTLIYCKVIDELKAAIPYEECDYMIGCIASMFAKGNKDRLTEDRIRRMLLSEIEDEFITYGQAVTLNPIYIKEVEKLKEMF